MKVTLLVVAAFIYSDHFLCPLSKSQDKSLATLNSEVLLSLPPHNFPLEFFLLVAG